LADALANVGKSREGLNEQFDAVRLAETGDESEIFNLGQNDLQPIDEFDRVGSVLERLEELRDV
jgi:hypothetical protein